MSGASLPTGWTEKPLKEVAGFSPKAPLEGLKTVEEVSFLPMAAVSEVSGRCDLSQTITPEEGKRRNLTYFEDADIIFAKITPCMENGKIARPIGLVGGRGFGSTEFHVLRPNSSIVGEYLRFFLVHDDFRINAERAMTGAVGQRRVPRKFLEEHPIPVPSFREQERIVEILEEQLSRLDAAVKSVQTVREKAAQFRRSLLHAAFTGALTQQDPGRISGGSLPEDWELHPLSNCLEKLKSGKRVERGWSPQCLNRPTQADEDWGVLKTTAVQMGKYQPEHHKALPSNLEPKRGLEVGNGDFLLTTTGPRSRCGVVCLAKSTPRNLIFSGKILRFRADRKKASASWLEYLMMSPVIQSTLDSLKVGTSDSSVSIGNRQVLDLQIPVPSIREQERIVEILEEQLSRLDATLAIADEVERKANALRRSLLHAAFTGELTRSWREAHV